jgi:hypothetical protein
MQREFAMFSKQAAFDEAEVRFTAEDLDRTIAHYRRLNATERKIAAAVAEAAVECNPEYGRLPAGVHGPRSPTD